MAVGFFVLVSVLLLVSFTILPRESPRSLLLPDTEKEQLSVAVGQRPIPLKSRPLRRRPQPTPVPQTLAPSVSVDSFVQRVDHSVKGVVARAELWDGRPTVFVTFGSAKYTSSLANWIAFAEDQGVSNWAVICLDDKLQSWMEARGMSCHAHVLDWKKGVWEPEITGRSCRGDRETKEKDLKTCQRGCEYDPDATCQSVTYVASSRSCVKCETAESQPEAGATFAEKRTTQTLWFARWQLLLRLLQQDVDVLLSDADAILIRSPKEILKEVGRNGADISGQRGTFPNWVAQVWGGAALCMGFSFWRSTQATKLFAVHMNGVIMKTGDDQIAVNVALEQLNIKWEGGHAWFANASTMTYGKDRNGLKVALFPHDTVPRKCDILEKSAFKRGTGSVNVAHCFQAAKTGEAKQAEAQSRGLWLLKEGWSDVIPQRDLGAYLATIRNNTI